MIGKERYMVNAALLLSFILVTVTGLLRWIFKPWAQGGCLADLVEAGCRLFGILHRWSGLLFAMLALYHIYQHWEWIVTMTEKIREEYSGVPGLDDEPREAEKQGEREA